jgi:methylthioribose-1-phosphate isomerase
VYLALRETKVQNEQFYRLIANLKNSRHTAVNLAWAVDSMLERIKTKDALSAAIELNDEEAIKSKAIANYGGDIIENIANTKNGTVNILTHCNAGWLAVLDDGTALAPIYEAKRRSIDIHVWVDETRPRNQGASLTAWELGDGKIKHTVIADNTGGHLMQHSLVDIVIVGADRVSRRGDVANKIGTYLKALAAKTNNIPFYVALPSSTFDFEILDGVKEIPIELRSGDEVRYMYGLMDDGSFGKVLVTPKDSNVINYGFDVTPRNLISGLITERGVIAANEQAICAAFL